ncbi:hypothetical protein [Clostridium senegalense]|uniref:hypothetical protein n=1 Tax=Clostridium senegalense TaxID=1465809 RepID=UPI0003018994|nr:hypothetical protein [Clostridium senegalense]
MPVIKYWEYTDEELIEKKMYPLLPLQLFNLRKELDKAQRKNDINRIKELSLQARGIASKIAKESQELLQENEILHQDFHKMLLAIQNLIEYLNRNYFKDERIEEEVITMTKTLYDPEVEKKGIEKGIEKGMEKAIGLMLKKGMDAETIAETLEVSLDEVNKVKDRKQ